MGYSPLIAEKKRKELLGCKTYKCKTKNSNNMENKKVIGFILKKEYPRCRKKVGDFEKYTTGEFSKYPEIWEPVYKERELNETQYSFYKQGKLKTTTIVNDKVNITIEYK